MRITKWAKNICCMFFLKNKVFQHVTEMLKLQTFHTNWTARACNFSKEISDQLWFSYYKKKDYSSSAIANFTLRTDGIPVKAVCKARLQWDFLEVHKFEYDSSIHWEPIPVTALVMIPI